MVQGRKPDLERRQVMVKLRAQGLTYEAIAKRLGISSQAVHQALCPPAHRRTVLCSGCGGNAGRPRPGGAVLCLTCLRRPAKAALSARLKGLRLAAGLSRADLSRQAAIGPSTLWQIETGRHWPHQATFVRLAKALGVKVAVLTGEEPLLLDPERNGKQRECR